MELTLMDVLTLVFALSALIVAIITAARQGKNIDDATAERLSKMADPATMDKLERAYQAASDERKRLLEMASALLAFIAPLTQLKSDDAALALLKDIQTPGPAAPEATVTTTTTTTMLPAAPETVPGVG
jgi:hypothetical protein